MGLIRGPALVGLILGGGGLHGGGGRGGGGVL